MTVRNARILNPLNRLMVLFAISAAKLVSQKLAYNLTEEPMIRQLLTMKLMLVVPVGSATKYARMNEDWWCTFVYTNANSIYSRTYPRLRGRDVNPIEE